MSGGEVWGLISDVHGNYAALEQAIQRLSGAGARKLAFLGDYLGRGDSDSCVRRIREVADVAIVGNRDLDWQNRVSAETRGYVLSLSTTAQSGQLLFSHGDARLTPALSTSQIGRDFARALPEMQKRGARVWAFGHSHHARVWRKRGESTRFELLSQDCVPLDDGAKYCVNVGTTGLPFPGKGGPSVALVDFQNGEIRRIALDRG